MTEAARPEPGSEPWLRRYARQVVIRAIGEEGQRRFGEARVLVAGTGPAAVACAVHLAAAGVGRVSSSDDAVLSAEDAARPPFRPADAGSRRGRALERALERLAGVFPAHAARTPSVVVRVGPGSTTNVPGTFVVVLVEGDGAGGAVVRVAGGDAGARPLAAASPIARAAGALAADAVMRALLGASAAAGIAIRADGGVTTTP